MQEQPFNKGTNWAAWNCRSLQAPSKRENRLLFRRCYERFTNAFASLFFCQTKSPPSGLDCVHAFDEVDEPCGENHFCNQGIGKVTHRWGFSWRYSISP